MPVERISGFKKLAKEDLRIPQGRNVFFDPADTELGAWVGCDLIEPGCTVLDLGSGSGAAAAAFVRCGAGKVFGVDISSESVSWARQHYCTPEYRNRISFILGDFETTSAADFRSLVSSNSSLNVVTSNPAYVPLPPGKGSAFKSIYGGPDGLKFVPPVLDCAVALKANLGITIGSYSSPRKAATLLLRRGYHIQAMTLAALEFGELTRQNPETIFELEQRGEAILWSRSGLLGYLIVGLSCTTTPRSKSLQPDELMTVLSRACSSASNELETLSDSSLPSLTDFPVRVLVLPTPSDRQHW